MKIISSTVIVLGTLLAASHAPAAVTVTLGGLDLNSAFNPSLGSSGASSRPLGGTSQTHSFVVDGLDIAEDGTANDSVEFSYLVTSTGGEIALVASTVYAYGVDGAADDIDNEIDEGEGLSFSDLGINVTFGDVPLTAQMDSAVFNSFFTRFPGGGDVDAITLTDGSGTPIAVGGVQDGGPSDLYSFNTPQPEFHLTTGSGGNGYGVDTISATFVISVAPEPSAFALLSLGGLGVLLRRRR